MAALSAPIIHFPGSQFAWSLRCIWMIILAFRSAALASEVSDGPNVPYFSKSPSGQYCLVMIPLSEKGDDGIGILYHSLTESPLWTVPWYSFSTSIADDGVTLLRFHGSTPQDKSERRPVIVVYRNGNEFRSYFDDDLESLAAKPATDSNASEGTQLSTGQSSLWSGVLTSGNRLATCDLATGRLIAVGRSDSDQPPLNPGYVAAMSCRRQLDVAAQLYRQLAKTNTTRGNIVLAPTSIFRVLSVLKSGSSGKSQEQLRKLMDGKQARHGWADGSGYAIGEVKERISRVSSIDSIIDLFRMQLRSKVFQRTGIILSNTADGVNVIGAIPGSRGSILGLRPRDMLRSVNSESVNSTTDFEAAMESSAELNQVAILRSSRVALRSGSIDQSAILRTETALWFHPQCAPSFAFKAKQLNQESMFFVADFRDPETVRTSISNWTRDATSGRLSGADLTISDTSRCIITTAFVFKSQWARKFQVPSTRAARFVRDDAESIQVDMMQQTSQFRIVQRNGFSALEIPYDGSASMAILLPSRSDGLKELEGSISSEFLLTCLDDLMASEVQNVFLKVPRFSIQASSDMKQALSTLGVTSVFEPSSDFDAMLGNSEQFWIDQIRHRVALEVNEAGTEAAAISGVSIVAKGGEVTKPRQFIADHPFFFTVFDRRTRMPLLVGRVVDPIR